MRDRSSVDLGFTDARFPAGTHICQIYGDADERNDSLFRYLASGLRAGECTACFSENVTEAELEAYFASEGIALDAVTSSGAFALHKTGEVYFPEGRFEPEHMLSLLTAFHESSEKNGYSNARVIGEMTSEIDRVPGGSRLTEYESRVSMLLRERPVTTVCQYDAHAFDGATIMDVLKVHPMMIVRGAVVRNPYFVPPEEFLR
jgi:hypothetical protein